MRHIKLDRVFIWHGEMDRIMPVGPARLLAKRIAACQATFYPQEGHFSVLVNRAADLLAALKPA